MMGNILNPAKYNDEAMTCSFCSSMVLLSKVPLQQQRANPSRLCYYPDQPLYHKLLKYGPTYTHKEHVFDHTKQRYSA